MRILVVLALVTMTISLTEGKVVSKCDLREHLMNASFRLTPKAQHHLTNEDFVAKIVCHVAKSSGFNTSAVTQMNIDEDGKPRRKRCAKHESDSKSTNHEYESSSHEYEYEEKGRVSNASVVTHASIDRDGARRRRNAGYTTTSQESEHVNHEAQWTLYGLFQLSDHLICSSGAESSSINLCEMDCADLINDNIDDDIDCLGIIKTKLENGSEHVEDVFLMAKLLFDMDCDRSCDPVNASEYFTEC